MIPTYFISNLYYGYWVGDRKRLECKKGIIKNLFLKLYEIFVLSN